MKSPCISRYSYESRDVPHTFKLNAQYPKGLSHSLIGTQTLVQMAKTSSRSGNTIRFHAEKRDLPV